MLTLDAISLRYGSKILFENITASVTSRDRIGLVGPNGAGKSTLLKILCDLESYDSGKVHKPNRLAIGYLPQDGIEFSGKTLYDEVASAFDNIISIQKQLTDAQNLLDTLSTESEEYTDTLVYIGDLEHRLEDLEAHKLKSKIECVLLGLGFTLEDCKQPTNIFSGGWKMRIALAKLLLQEPALLLLDEPTNHLDLPSLRWFEQYLKRYEGSLIIISHDRSFLDSLCNRIFALEHKGLNTYTGNYTEYVAASQKRKEILIQSQKSQQRQLAKTQTFIDRFRYKSSKAKQVQSRIKAMEKVERIELEDDASSIHFKFPPPPRSGHRTVLLESIDKSYNDLEVFNNLNLELTRGDKIAFVGPNGAGKSTLAKMLAGIEEPSGGVIELGHNVKRAYFAQHQAEALDPNAKTLDIVENTPTQGAVDPRTLLGAFLFRGDDVFKPVSVLSGGEKCRLALAQILLQEANFIIFDEPTNHLDIASKAVLQEALVDFSGTLVIVSHDRDFLDPIVNKVLEVKPHSVKLHLGSMSDYLAELDAAEAALEPRKSETAGNNLKQAGKEISAKERRKQEAAKRARLAPLKKKQVNLEQQIEDWEEEVKNLESAMMDPQFFQRGQETTDAVKKHESLKRKLEQAYQDWETLEAEITAKSDG